MFKVNNSNTRKRCEIGELWFRSWHNPIGVSGKGSYQISHLVLSKFQGINYMILPWNHQIPIVGFLMISWGKIASLKAGIMNYFRYWFFQVNSNWTRAKLESLIKSALFARHFFAWMQDLWESSLYWYHYFKWVCSDMPSIFKIANLYLRNNMLDFLVFSL